MCHCHHFTPLLSLESSHLLITSTLFTPLLVPRNLIANLYLCCQNLGVISWSKVADFDLLPSKPRPNCLWKSLFFSSIYISAWSGRKYSEEEEVKYIPWAWHDFLRVWKTLSQRLQCISIRYINLKIPRPFPWCQDPERNVKSSHLETLLVWSNNNRRWTCSL